MYKQGLLTIDYSTRKIVLPENVSVAGVEDDSLSEVFVFLVDRYYDDVDLYTIPLYVDFRNSIGETDFNSITTGIEIVGDDQLKINWRIPSKVTRFPGYIYFALRFEKVETVDYEDRITFSWKTTPVKIKIAEKLDVFGSIPEEEIEEERVIIASFAEQLDDHVHDSDIHVTAEEKTRWTDHIITDDVTGADYKIGLSNGELYVIPVESE